MLRDSLDNRKRCYRLIANAEYVDILRIRDNLFYSLQQYFRKRNYREVHIPVLTRSISSPGALNGKIPSDVDPFCVDYFGREMFLSQSSQLYLEALIKIFPKVFTIMPSFRNEKSDHRHLNEFWHVEIEQADTVLKEILRVQENLFCFLVTAMLNSCEDEIVRLAGKTRLSELIKIKKPFPRITYKNALIALRNEFGMVISLEQSTTDLGHFSSLHERKITQLHSGQPVFVTHYPTREVAFYHKVKPDEPDVVLNADLLAPDYGEVIGSGQRINTRSELEEKIKFFELNKCDYVWYIQLRRNDNPNSGFGMGIERFITWLCGLKHIQHAIAFPRLDNTYLP